LASDRLPFEVPANTEYGGIRAKLEAALIAAHTYATGATIVTANTGKFKRIRGLTAAHSLPGREQASVRRQAAVAASSTASPLPPERRW
jgi:hypothetical protein